MVTNKPDWHPMTQPTKRQEIMEILKSCQWYQHEEPVVKDHYEGCIDMEKAATLIMQKVKECVPNKPPEGAIALGYTKDVLREEGFNDCRDQMLKSLGE